MSTISNERLGAFILGSQPWNEEIEQMATELLALRKEREWAEPVAWTDSDELRDAKKSGVGYLFGMGAEANKFADPHRKMMLYTAPPAPAHVDEIAAQAGIDPAIADAYMQGCHDTEARQAETDTTSQQLESLAGKAVGSDENGNLPCPFCGGRCDPNGWMGSYDDGVPKCGPECEDCGATANSIEEWNRRSTALAGKAVVPEGWKLVPVELTKEMRGKIHPFAEATCLNCGRQVVADCEDNVTASWNDMLAVAPEPCK
ncbi:hypothetical protein [Cronobacter sakazakii]|uniref:hypothetical protein n=1 Tax=Cronobacter sakazakii TaxID=28141 RepID=UPI000CFAB0AD|nr:hypothetical protein [Cronobacter sakazakii]